MASVRVKFRMVQAASMAASITSFGFHVFNLENIGLQFIFTGTGVTGAWTFQGSNDSTDGVDGHWFPVTLADPPTDPSGSTGDDFGVDLNQWPWEWVRIVYTRTSGTGTLDVIAIGKQI